MAGRGKGGGAVPALGALAMALLLLSMPVGLIETVVASSGLSEAMPAAAPPLGWTARLLLAGFGGLMMLGLIWAGRRDDEKQGRPETARGVSKMGFALSKLSWLGRSRGTDAGSVPLPALRRADAHPDAPAREPIFASRDFGGLDIFARTVPGRGEAQAEIPEEPEVVSLSDLAMPSLADAAPEEASFVPLNRAARAQAADEAVYEEIEDVAPAAPSRPAILTEGLSIAELTERLERGLAQRKRTVRPGSAQVIADMPVAAAVPVRDNVEQGVDEALRAALGTLRTMTARAR